MTGTVSGYRDYVAATAWGVHSFEHEITGNREVAIYLTKLHAEPKGSIHLRHVETGPQAHD